MFVNEKGIIVYDQDGKPIRVYDRTIDHDRNVILKRGGDGRGVVNRGRPDPGEEYFVLQGDDFHIRFEGLMSYEKVDEINSELFWKIRRVWDLEGVEGREKEIMDLIVEALTTYGVNFGMKNVNSITVCFTDSVLDLLNKSSFEPVTTQI